MWDLPPVPRWFSTAHRAGGISRLPTVYLRARTVEPTSTVENLQWSDIAIVSVTGDLRPVGTSTGKAGAS